jgi:signal transduction histidine kinase
VNTVPQFKQGIAEEGERLRSYAETLTAMSRDFEGKIRELSTIRRIGDALAHALDMKNVCKIILDSVIDGLGAETGVLILYESSNHAPVAQVFSSASTRAEGNGFYPTDRMIDRAIKKRNPVIIRDVPTESRYSLKQETATRSAMLLPLVSRKFDIGVIGLGHSHREAFRREQIQAGHLIASQAAISLENVKLLHKLIGMNESLEEKVLERTQRLHETNQRLLELQNQLIQAETMKVIGQFTAGIGQNLRTPLSVILSAADLIKLHGDGNRKIVEYAEKIAQQSARMAEIIENLIEKCQKTQRREQEKLNINHILRKELSFMEANLDFKHKVVKECVFDDKLPKSKGFCGDFSQTFVNLINNAVDAMRENKTKKLTIRTRHDRSHLYVDIRDNGCGISKDDQEKILDFSFARRARVYGSGSPSGMGIGLFNSKHLMAKYGAQIRVKSRPGDTTFTVQIPLHGKSNPVVEPDDVLDERGMNSDE